MATRLTALTATLVSLLGGNPVCAEELLQQVQEAHRSSVQSLRTFNCEVRLNWKGPKQSWTETGKYWRSDQVVRIQHASENDSGDVVIRDGVVTGLFRRKMPDGQMHVSASLAPSKRYIACDAWLRALLTFLHPEHGGMLFDELLTRASEKPQAARAVVDGRNLIQVTVLNGPARYQIWFDPEVNYLVRKLSCSITEADGRQSSADCVVAGFREAAPGLYFPERVDSVSDDGVELVAAFTNLRVNLPMPANAFKLEFPHGTNMMDLVKGTIYRVDSEGRDIGPILDAGGKPVTLARNVQPPAVSAPGGFTGPTLEEPRSWTAWILPASAGILVISLILLLTRRWRARRV